MSGNFELRHWRPRSQAKTIAIPATLDLHPITTPPPAANGDFKVDHWKEDDDGGGGYTSLRDLLSSPTANGAINSPTPGGAGEIQIKNRLVKQAAYAYLQPTPSSTKASRRRRRFSFRRAVVVLGSCFCFIRRFLRTIRIRKRN